MLFWELHCPGSTVKAEICVLGLFHCLVSLVKAEICVLAAALSWVYSKGQGHCNVEVYIGRERVLVSFFSIPHT